MHLRLIRRRAVALATALFAASAVVGAPAAAQETGHGDEAGASARATAEDVPLYDDLGEHHYPVETVTAEVQAYFDQGLRLYYAFNHREAIRAFRHAQSLDPDCVLCWWGEALAWGPNINLPMDSAAAVAAYEALQGARAAVERRGAGPGARSPKERALVQALAQRYDADPPGDRTALDSAYARAMGRLADRYPADDELAVLYGEALMDLRPWDYWTEEAELRPTMREALRHFETVQERSPEHPGACHFFIHLVEKEQPERAVECAERLAGLMPGAGHLVHMPGHIYVRVGRYAEAIEANRHAVHADETYISDQRPGMGVYTAGYYPHNYDFMAFAAAMVGRRELAVEAAERMVEVIPEAMVGDPGLPFLQHYVMRPLQMRVRFGLWEEILSEPAPPAGLLHSRAMWRYGRGRAHAATGELDAARADLARLRELAEGPGLDGVRLEFNPSQAVLGVAAEVLAGHISAAEGHLEAAVEHLREAVRREEALLYGEPPEWSVPVRQELGEVLLEAGEPDEAARAFQEDLERFPDNGWSLRGLARARAAQGRVEEARELRKRFRATWQGSSPGAGSGGLTRPG